MFINIRWYSFLNFHTFFFRIMCPEFCFYIYTLEKYGKIIFLYLHIQKKICGCIHIY